MKYWIPLISLLISAFTAGSALAEPEVVGIAQPWQLGFQEAVTPVMRELTALHNFLLIIITAITVFVLALLGYICIRFRKSANPVASKNSHNTVIEVIWTVVPVLILGAIFIPSYRLFFDCIKSIGCEEDGMPQEADLTLKVVGYQWYWNYEYPDEGIKFDSNIKKDNELLAGEPRLLAVDNPVVVPVNANVRVLVTGGDVIHSWAMPAFGVKQDTVPGRLNETWFRAEKVGTYYGQCSELCGRLHGFMPIRVDVVSKEAYAAWLEEAKQKFAIDRFGSVNVASHY